MVDPTLKAKIEASRAHQRQMKRLRQFGNNDVKGMAIDVKKYMIQNRKAHVIDTNSKEERKKQKKRRMMKAMIENLLKRFKRQKKKKVMMKRLGRAIKEIRFKFKIQKIQKKYKHKKRMEYVAMMEFLRQEQLKRVNKNLKNMMDQIVQEKLKAEGKWAKFQKRLYKTKRRQIEEKKLEKLKDDLNKNEHILEYLQKHQKELDEAEKEKKRKIEKVKLKLNDEIKEKEQEMKQKEEAKERKAKETAESILKEYKDVDEDDLDITGEEKKDDDDLINQSVDRIIAEASSEAEAEAKENKNSPKISTKIYSNSVTTTSKPKSLFDHIKTNQPTVIIKSTINPKIKVKYLNHKGKLIPDFALIQKSKTKAKMPEGIFGSAVEAKHQRERYESWRQKEMTRRAKEKAKRLDLEEKHKNEKKLQKQIDQFLDKPLPPAKKINSKLLRNKLKSDLLGETNSNKIQIFSKQTSNKLMRSNSRRYNKNNRHQIDQHRPHTKKRTISGSNNSLKRRNSSKRGRRTQN
jgi:hypothetical protein